MKKWLFGFLAAALAASVLLQTACAAETGRFLQGYQIQDGQLQILCAELEEGDYQLTLEEQALPVTTSAVGQENILVTVYCLVDVSGSMNDAQMEQVYDTLRAISASMGEEDNMVISALGNNAVSSGLLTTAQQREDAIAALQRSNENTNLYAGIVESLKILQTNTTFHTKRCLMVMSDGEDYQDTGFVEQEVINAIHSAGLPVYTVATLRKNPTQGQKESAKLLGSFARYSIGGSHSAPVVDGITAAEAGELIWNSLENSVVLIPDLSEIQLDADQKEAAVKVVYTAGSTRMEDTLTIPVSELPMPEAELPPSPIPTPTPSPQEQVSEPPEATQDPESGFPWLIVILAAAAVVVIAVICALVFLSRRKKSVGTPEAETAPEAETVPGPDSFTTGLQSDKTPADTQSKPSAGCIVVLNVLGYADKVRYVELPDKKPVSIGRDQGQADVVLDGRDSRLSGVHCQMMRDGKNLYVMDQGSTNGSFINGVPIQGKGWMPLADGETLRVGSSEYRIRIQFDL